MFRQTYVSGSIAANQQVGIYYARQASLEIHAGTMPTCTSPRVLTRKRLHDINCFRRCNWTGWGKQKSTPRVSLTHSLTVLWLDSCRTCRHSYTNHDRPLRPSPTFRCDTCLWYYLNHCLELKLNIQSRLISKLEFIMPDRHH